MCRLLATVLASVSNEPASERFLMVSPLLRVCSIHIHKRNSNNSPESRLPSLCISDDGPLELWLIAGNPCDTLGGIEPNQSGQEPYGHSTVEHQAMLCW